MCRSVVAAVAASMVLGASGAALASTDMGHRVVAAHRGRLDYRANLPHGARFIVALPLAADVNAEIQTSS